MLRRPYAIVLALLSVAAAGACSSTGLPSLPSATPTPISPTQLETGAVPPASAGPPASAEITTIASGTPTEVYTRVAGPALRCWFGANGPLKATHIFHAEAASPTDGGPTEIVLQERDPTLRDQRGARAFRVSFVGQGGSVAVGITPIKVQPPLADLMVRDVESWAQGGTGCQAGALSPPAQVEAQPAKSSKAKSSQNSKR